MPDSSDRLLKPELLPVELWHHDFREEGKSETGLVRLPKLLADAYARVIDRLNLRPLSESRDPENPPVGGLSQDQADKHFAQAFDGSCARVQLALMDPFNRAPKASNNLLRSLSGNRVTIADAPSGAGAATYALLTTIAELRRQNILPRQPLDVHVVAGEISEPARIHASLMLEELGAALEQQAIFLSVEFHPWDVTNDLSNTDYIRQITLASQGREKRLLVIANFNGFLVSGSKQKVARPQLTELMRYCSGPNSYCVWIEPNMNPATKKGGLFDWLRVQLSTVWSKFAKEDTHDADPESLAVCRTLLELPLHPPNTVRSGLSLMSFDLTRK